MPEEIDTRWNSTFEFLKTYYIYRISITTTFNQYITKFSKVILQELIGLKLMILLFFSEKFYSATVEFFSVYCPTICNLLTYIVNLPLLLMKYKLKAICKNIVTKMIEFFLKNIFFPIPSIYLVGAIFKSVYEI